MPYEDVNRWAEAIALRIADEWSGAEEFPDSAKTLQDVIETLLKLHPEECERLIGTGIIEETYFDIPT